jgi:serine/threonine protein kinase
VEKYIGKLLDNRYEILQVIGTGGMAVVYKALCHRLNRLVAVKILKDEFSKDEEFRKRLHAESHAIAMLSHPNIVAVYDVSRSNSIEYIVMELMDGMTLKQYMDRKGILSWKEALHFVTQILKALSHAHSKGIIHRDIKPHNIMLLRDGSLKVTDFGIARFTAAQGTLSKEALGSVHYISPEQAKGSNIDARTDIYSVGVVLYEMLTGRLPYEGDTPVSIAIQHINSMPLTPRELNPDIPKALEAITMKAMNPSLKQRYASAEEMLNELEEFRKNPNIQIEYERTPATVNSDSEPTKPVGIKLSSNGGLDDTDDLNDADNKNKRKLNIPLIVGVITGLVFVSGVITLMLTLFGAGGSMPDITTPYLVGLNFEDVTADEKYKDFRIVEDSREYSNVYDKGEIISQRPKEGRAVKPGSEIHVVISEGPKTIMLKDLTNMTEKQARIEVENRLGLKLSVEYETSDDILEGYVIRSEPDKDSELQEGDTVTVFVSKGKEVKTVKVPKLIGKTREEALRDIENAGLLIGSEKTIESDLEAGRVISQSIDENSEVGEKTKISIEVSSGTGKTEIPADNKPAGDSKNNPPDTGTPTGGQTGGTESGLARKTIPIKLPSTTGDLTVVVKANGKVVYNKVHKSSEKTVNVTIEGKGETDIEVYINNILFNEITVTF